MFEHGRSCFDFKEGVLVFQCQILPKSSVNQIVGIHNNRLKIKLTAAPTDGKANKALIKFLSKEFDVAQSSVTIEKGEFDHKKTLRITGLNVAPPWLSG